MKVAISMRSVHGPLLKGELSVVDFLKYAASLAVDGVELDDIYLLGSVPDYPQIQEVLRETGLKVSCYDIHHQMAPLKGQERDEALGKIKAELEMAEMLGAEQVQIVGEVFDPAVTASEIESLILELVDIVLPLIKGKNLTLAIENPESAAFQSRHMASLLQKTNDPQVKVGFNMANSLVAGENPEAALERLKDHIAHVRAVDVRLAHRDEESQSGMYVGCVVGLGLVPLARLFSSLYQIEYDGWVSLEFTGLEEAYFGTEASLKNLRQYLDDMQHEAMHPGEYQGEPMQIP